jgi:hypothetical protein
VLGAKAMVEGGYRDSYGLGRHVAGSNFFHYIRDPWNSLAEMYWDMDVIPEDGKGWDLCDSAPDKTFAVWSHNPPPEDFVTNFEPPA